ncbi:integrase core domain-containing protein [Bradyrhizobium sp. BWA-3-5]|uniref:integrase core domain-containing protein n=1 Tax=Bradyrhizobium sp. BWA-3-5 TaxID=3080013 RepID=UPI00397AC59F
MPMWRSIPDATPTPRPASSSFPGSLPLSGSYHPDRQWQRVYRPLRRRYESQTARSTFRPASVRRHLCKPQDRASPDQPYRPQTNGLVERFNRRIAEAIGREPKRGNAHRFFACQADRNAFLSRFVADYNRTRLKCLGYRAPIEALLANHPGPNAHARGWRGGSCVA